MFVAPLVLTGCGKATPAAQHPSPAPTAAASSLVEPSEDPYVDDSGITRTHKVTAVVVSKGYQTEEGEKGPESRAYCEVKITNNSTIKVSASVDVLFNSADGSQQIDTDPAGVN